VTFEARAMGSPLRLTIVTASDRAAYRRAVAAWRAVRREFEASEQVMSRFRDTSEITRLNRRDGHGPGTRISPRLRIALTTCDRARRLTDGRFDPRVLRSLERLGDRGSPIPSRDLDPRHRRAAEARVVDVDGAGRVRLPEPVDLGGIGKGLALRWAAAVVARAEFDGFLIDAGGDLVAAGQPAEGGPWRIGIEDPCGTPDPLAVITGQDDAVATSSIRRRTWLVGGRTVHHLIDPATGQSARGGLLAVTVAASDPAWSEVWSKALFIEGRQGIAGLARARGLAAWWVTEDGSVGMTAAARLRTVWVAGDSS
jgi:thiamine biosynthesis lipoprotein